MRRGGVRVEGGLIRPRLDDREVVGAHRVLQDVVAEASGFLAACFRDPLDEIGPAPLGAADGIHVTDHVDRSPPPEPFAAATLKFL